MTGERLDRIRTEAGKLKFGRALLTVALMPFYVVGWSLGRAWTAIAHVVAAMKIGWKEGNGH